jgi:protein XagA
VAPCLAVLLALQSQPALAGAWPMREGEAQQITATDTVVSLRSFDARGRPLPSGVFTKTESRVFTQYGLTNEVTLVTEFAGLTRRLPTAAFEAVGRADIGARMLLARRDGWVLSAEARAIANGDRRLSGGSAWDAPWAADLRLMAGTNLSIAGLNGFTEADIGYRKAHPRRRDAFVARLGGGIRFAGNWMLLAQASLTAETGGKSSRLPPRRSAISGKLSVVYEGFRPWAVEAGIIGTPIGRNTGEQLGLTLALWRSF